MPFNACVRYSRLHVVAVRQSVGDDSRLPRRDARDCCRPSTRRLPISLDPQTEAIDQVWNWNANVCGLTRFGITMKSTRQFPGNKTLYQRLVISRLHYDVNRRYRDRSFTGSLTQLGTGQALDLYSEVLTNLQSHYVDPVDWSRVFLHGTAALEVALTEEKFVNHVLADADPDAVEQFRQTIHRRLTNRSTASRFDLRANVAYVAQLAQVRNRAVQAP